MIQLLFSTIITLEIFLSRWKELCLEFRGRSDSNSVFPVGKLKFGILVFFKILSGPLNTFPWTQPAPYKSFSGNNPGSLSLPEDKVPV